MERLGQQAPVHSESGDKLRDPQDPLNLKETSEGETGGLQEQLRVGSILNTGRALWHGAGG